MKGQFYVVYLKPDPAVDEEVVKKAMNKARDWYKASSDFWVVYTTTSAERLYSRLKPAVNDKGRVFIAKLDMSDRQGWMSKGFWEWVKRDREERD